MNTLRFSIHGLFCGLAKSQGIVTIGDNGLIFQYVSRDTLAFGLIESSIREVVVPFALIESIETNRSFWSRRITADLQLRDLDLALDFPKHQYGLIKLQFRTHSYKEVKQFIKAYEAQITNNQIHNIVSRFDNVCDYREHNKISEEKKRRAG